MTTNRDTDNTSRLAAHWDEFYPHYMSQISEYQREVVTNQTTAIRAAFRASTSSQREYHYVDREQYSQYEVPV